MGEQKKDMKKKIGADFYHEAVDRVAIAGDHIDRHLLEHPAVKDCVRAQKKIEKAAYLLAEAYQILGGIMHDKIEQEKC